MKTLINSDDFVSSENRYFYERVSRSHYWPLNGFPKAKYFPADFQNFFVTALAAL
jgi:hypothetical protein